MKGINDSENHSLLSIPILDDDNASGLVSYTLLTSPFGKETRKLDCIVVDIRYIHIHKHIRKCAVYGDLPKKWPSI